MPESKEVSEEYELDDLFSGCSSCVIQPILRTLGPNSIEKFQLEFWLEKPLDDSSFGLRFLHQEKAQKWVVWTRLRIKMESQSVFQAKTQAKNVSIESPPRASSCAASSGTRTARTTTKTTQEATDDKTHITFGCHHVLRPPLKEKERQGDSRNL